MSGPRIGLGCTLLERALNGGRLDGIGVYNRSLRAELERRADVSVLPVCFPPKPWHKAIARPLPGKGRFGAAYGLSAVLSATLALQFPGAAALAGRVDLYHAPDHLIPRLKRTPVVATICDALAVQRPDWIDAGPATFRSRLFKASAGWARRVIAISTAMVPDIVQHFGVPEEHIDVVHMGIGPEWLAPVSSEEKQALLVRHGLKEGYFLFVGTLQPRKNVEAIVAAYAALPAELRAVRQLVVAGQAGWGSEALAARLRGGAAKWLRYVPADELRALYQNAGVFVFPSLSEGFGIPVLEAFASGVPVVTSNQSSLPEVAGNAALLVDPRSHEELARAMRRLVEDCTLADELVRRGRTRAAQMSWAICAEKTLAVYRKAL